MEYYVGIFCEGFNLVQLLETTLDSVDSELGLKYLGFVGITDDDGDIKGAGIWMVQQACKHSAADIAWRGKE